MRFIDKWTVKRGPKAAIWRRQAALAGLFLCLLGGAAQAQEADLILGLWMTEDKDSVVQFYECDGAFCGRFYWLQDDSAENPSLDDINPDPVLKQRPLCGLTFMGGFARTEEGGYDSGWIYSPRHGSTFSAQVSLSDPNTLMLRGFVFIPFLGGSQTWKRVQSAETCHLMVNF